MTPDARAGAEASLTSARGVDLLFANLETHCVVGSPAAIAAQLGVVLWHVLGCDARADDAAAEALANRLTRAGQQAPRRCRSRDRAGASFSPRISSQLDEDQASRRRWRDSCLPPTTRTPSGPTRSSPCRERRTPKIAKGRRPPSSRAGDCLRGEPIAALANTRTAEAIVRAIRADDRYPASSAPKPQTSRHQTSPLQWRVPVADDTNPIVRAMWVLHSQVAEARHRRVLCRTPVSRVKRRAACLT